MIGPLIVIPVDGSFLLNLPLLCTFHLVWDGAKNNMAAMWCQRTEQKSDWRYCH